MSGNVKKFFVPAVLVILLLVQLKTYEDVQELRNQVQLQAMGPDSVRNTLSAEISGMQARLEETLRQEASALSSFQWEMGDLDTETLKAALTVSVTPKEVTTDTRVRVQISNGEIASLEKKGVTYTGTVQVGLFEEISMKVLIDRGGVTTVEEPESYIGSLWEYYLPKLDGDVWYSAAKRGKDATVTVSGNARIYEGKVTERKNDIQTLKLRCTLDGKELWEKPLTIEEGSPPDFPQYLAEFDGVEKSPWQTLDLVLIATDSYGLVYHYTLPYNFLNAGYVQGSSGNFTLAAVYKADGTLLYLA